MLTTMYEFERGEVNK